MEIRKTLNEEQSGAVESYAKDYGMTPTAAVVSCAVKELCRKGYYKNKQNKATTLN